MLLINGALLMKLKTLEVFNVQGSPGFGIPGQQGPKGENGERVSLKPSTRFAVMENAHMFVVLHSGQCRLVRETRTQSKILAHCVGVHSISEEEDNVKVTIYLLVQGQDGSKGDKGDLGISGDPGKPGLRGKDVSKSSADVTGTWIPTVQCTSCLLPFNY